MAADPISLFFERLNKLLVERKASDDEIDRVIAILGDTQLGCEQFLAKLARGEEIPNPVLENVMQRMRNLRPSKYLDRYLSTILKSRTEEEVYYYSVICLPFTYIDFSRKARKQQNADIEQAEKKQLYFRIRDHLIDIQRNNMFVKFPRVWETILEKCMDVIVYFKNHWIERVINHSALLDIPEKKQIMKENPRGVLNEEHFIRRDDYSQIIELAILNNDYEFLQTIAGHIRKHADVTCITFPALFELNPNPYYERFYYAYFTLISIIKPSDIYYYSWRFDYASEELKRMYADIFRLSVLDA